MKKLFIYGTMALMALTSCNDFLDKAPLDAFTNTPAYWSNTSNLDNQCNTFYNNYSGYGNGSGGGWFYFKTLSDDQVDYQSTVWTYTSVVATSTNWSDPFTEIRRANYIIEGLQTSSLDDAVKANYEGLARLNRAWEYYQLVRMYGDVQWITTVVDPADKDVVYGPRTDRDIVMDNVLEDLNYAASTITGTNKQRFSADMALAMKADITLYEGTYCKYRNASDNAGKAADNTRAEKYLRECVAACEALMTKGYSLNPSYKGNYNSISLSSNPEMIFYKPYSQNVFMHSTIDYTVNTRRGFRGQPGRDPLPDGLRQAPQLQVLRPVPHRSGRHRPGRRCGQRYCIKKFCPVSVQCACQLRGILRPQNCTHPPAVLY